MFRFSRNINLSECKSIPKTFAAKLAELKAVSGSLEQIHDVSFSGKPDEFGIKGAIVGRSAYQVNQIYQRYLKNTANNSITELPLSRVTFYDKDYDVRFFLPEHDLNKTGGSATHGNIPGFRVPIDSKYQAGDKTFTCIIYMLLAKNTYSGIYSKNSFPELAFYLLDNNGVRVGNDFYCHNMRSYVLTETIDYNEDYNLSIIVGEVDKGIGNYGSDFYLEWNGDKTGGTVNGQGDWHKIVSNHMFIGMKVINTRSPKITSGTQTYPKIYEILKREATHHGVLESNPHFKENIHYHIYDENNLFVKDRANEDRYYLEKATSSNNRKNGKFLEESDIVFYQPPSGQSINYLESVIINPLPEVENNSGVSIMELFVLTNTSEIGSASAQVVDASNGHHNVLFKDGNNSRFAIDFKDDSDNKLQRLDRFGVSQIEDGGDFNPIKPTDTNSSWKLTRVSLKIPAGKKLKLVFWTHTTSYKITNAFFKIGFRQYPHMKFLTPATTQPYKKIPILPLYAVGTLLWDSRNSSYSLNMRYGANLNFYDANTNPANGVFNYIKRMKVSGKTQYFWVFKGMLPHNRYDIQLTNLGGDNLVPTTLLESTITNGFGLKFGFKKSGDWVDTSFNFMIFQF